MAGTYIWRRQFSFDQMKKIRGIQRMRSFLSDATNEMSAFARCSLVDPGKDYHVYTSFAGVWQGVPVYFVPVIRPLFYDIAFKAYSKAIAEVAEYYPGFDEIEITDGPLTGERRIWFPKALDEAAMYWVNTRFWRIVEHGEVTAKEHVQVKIDPNGCRVGDRQKAVITAAIDRDETNAETVREFEAVMKTGKLFPVSDAEKRGDPRMASQLLTELSLPELALLNWELVRKPASAADRALFAAIEKFDYEAVKSALDSGADANCVAFGGTPLYEVCYFLWCEQHPCRDEAEYEENKRNYPGPSASEKIRMIDLLVDHGASVNLAAPDEETPLDEACCCCDREVILHLVDLGADPSIRSYLDDWEGSWGGAWEAASRRCDTIINNDDETGWLALSERFKPPFGGFPRRQ